MIIKGAETIAEYAIMKWAIGQGFAMENFVLTMHDNEGKLEDRYGDSIVLVYDKETKSVHEKGE